MALFIRQNDERSKLQEQVAAELQERAKQRAALQDRPDGVSDTEYVKNTSQTGRFAWIWIIVVIAVIVAVIYVLSLAAK